LQRWVATARELQCTLLLDEFYSHYVWTGAEDQWSMVSAAQHVEDVNRDPVVLFDGLTKNWRYPGWRCTWVVGPKQVIEAVASTGSFLDGGGSKPLQRAALPLLEPALVLQETAAIQKAFRRKRKLMMKGLRAAGIKPRGGAGGDLLLLGRPLDAAGATQRRHAVPQGRAGREGDLRSW
jgi:aspartate/methionine/tyrosine aminotransferase